MAISFYDEVGGLPTLQHVHKIFYDKIYEHPWLKLYFENFKQEAIENRQTLFMGEKFGGPEYFGKPLKQAHENMYITQELADVRHQILRESLQEAGLNEEQTKRWLRIDEAFMVQVTKKSVESFYKDYHFKYKKRIIHSNPGE